MFKRASFINTPLQRGAETCAAARNRFSGLDNRREIGTIPETAKAVELVPERLDTPLKRGVNERASYRGTSPGSAGFQPAVPQVSNLLRLGWYTRPADRKSAVQHAKSLRYGPRSPRRLFE